jgi:hypothetical protein
MSRQNRELTKLPVQEISQEPFVNARHGRIKSQRPNNLSMSQAARLRENLSFETVSSCRHLIRQARRVSYHPA